MTARAEGDFALDSWDQEAYDEAEGAVLAEARIGKTFTGDLAGTSTTRILMCRAQVETSAAYGGFERFTGTLAGRRGSFVLRHEATAHAEEGSSLSWTVVPDSGTGELRGLRGDGQILQDPDGAHRYVLTYELP
ncbi:DUF3224 domain-containing protein [Micromonospora auratinigra]|uniref:DUF3224 domain-containing protein n=1 Tax=Micromonospora auratinigra TaxID=261654 RepID=A0A1A8Z3Z4_9ACTN|nr:DUF3224 domain-containing protein [Micromonospora auratinigra]SBT38527.1 Protein of unknown function (DUF3224) [Micromonospora auratinigra]